MGDQVKLTSNPTPTNKVVKGKTIQLSVPAKIDVVCPSQSRSIFQKKKGKLIGGIEFLAKMSQKSFDQYGCQTKPKLKRIRIGDVYY